MSALMGLACTVSNHEGCPGQMGERYELDCACICHRPAADPKGAPVVGVMPPDRVEHPDYPCCYRCFTARHETCDGGDCECPRCGRHPSQAAKDPTPCPECAVGKCGNCDGRTWDRDADDYTVCPCAGAGHG